MPYADSDFFLALLKKEDWLNENAKRILKKYSGKIWTSEWTIIEIFMLCNRYNLNPEVVINSIRQLVEIRGDVALIFSVAHLMKEKDIKTFDALHAITSSNDKIISSDSIYDIIGLDRIKLEE